MGSIPKIVSTPLKWVSKKVLNETLLKFPGGDEHSPIACTYCPEMCRFACPTAVVSGNDAVTPCNKNSLLYKERKWPGQAAQGGALWPIYDCTGCGRCTEFCVYGMPVGDQLFAARAQFSWEPARNAAIHLSDAEDPVGDLAEELGDAGNAERRMKAFLLRSPAGQVAEPRSQYFLKERGQASVLSLEAAFGAPLTAAARSRLGAGRWLLHESVWHSRKLAAAGRVATWYERLRADGARLERPFHHGMDCIDCGGEGAYGRLFPEQARAMARDFWERDRDRADGLLCVSARCAGHFRAVLGNGVPVVALAELTA